MSTAAEPVMVNNASFDAVASPEATTVAGGHTAPLRGARIAEAFELVRRLPHLPAAELPTNADLDALLAAHAEPPHSASAA